jgi:type 1 glutamine amidotransferase
LDVVVVSNFVGIGGTFVDTAHRSRFTRFIRTKGLVSTHWSIDSYGAWAAWDSLHGARFQNKVSGDRYGTLRIDSAAMNNPDWRLLNRGLPDTARFVEEWISFTTNSSTIRAVPGLTVTTNLSEASLSGGLGGMREMGVDHVYSWYRTFQEGGRLFYTGLGHRAELFTGAPSIDSTGDTTRPSNHYLRRQLYNAILWAAGADSNGVVSVQKNASQNISKFSAAARIVNHGGTLVVSVLQSGAHRVEVRALNGALVASRRGTGRVDHRIERLRPGVYTISVTANGHTLARLVTIP